MTEIAHLPPERRMIYRVWPLVLQQLEVRPHGPEESLKVEWRAVSGAYVALMQVTKGGEKKETNWGDIQFGRTSSKGSVAAREMSDIKSVPSDDSVNPRVHVVAGEEYRLFWTPVKEVFEEFGNLLQTQPEQWDAIWSKYAPQTYQASPAADFAWKDGHALLDKQKLLELNMKHDEQELIFHIAFRSPKQAQQFHVKQAGDGFAAYLDVTPPALRAMYAAEILAGYAARKVSAAKHLSTLVRCHQIAEMTAGCLPDAGIESAQKHTTREGTPEYIAHHAYRHYVWQCAALEIDENAVKDSLISATDFKALSARARRVAEMSMSLVPGKETPKTMRGVSGPIRHPWLRRQELNLKDDHMLVASEDSSPIMAYFYMYRFGFQVLGVTKGDASPNSFHSKIAAVLERVKGCSGDELRTLQRQLLAGAPHSQFIEELRVCFDPRRDSQRMTNLWQRYADVSATCGVTWWTELAAWKPEDWKEFSPKVVWMKEVPGGVAGVLKNLYESRFKHYDLHLRAANELLTTFYRYHVAAASGDSGLKVFDTPVPKLKARARVDFIHDTIEIRGSTPDGGSLAPLKLHFLTELRELGAERLEPVPGKETRARTRALKKARAKNQMVHYDVEIPCDFAQTKLLGSEIPAGLSFMGTFLNNIVGITSAIQQLSRGEGEEEAPFDEKVDVAFELSKNAMQLVVDARDLAEALSPKVESVIAVPKPPPGSVAAATRPKSFWRLARDAAKVVGETKALSAIDAADNLYSGMQILVSEDGAMRFEQRRGESLRAATEGVKGLLTVGVGLASAGEVIVANGLATTFLGVGAATLGWAVVVGGIAVFTIDTLLDALSDWNKDMNILIKALDQALREELALDDSKYQLEKLEGGATAGSRWAAIPQESQTSRHIELVQSIATLQLAGSGPKSA